MSAELPGGVMPPEDPVPGEGFYRFLLRLHPRTFRRRYRRDMVELFRDAWRREAEGRSLLIRAGFWSRTAVGTVLTASRQRLGPTSEAQTTKTKGGPTMRNWTMDLRYALRFLRRRPAYVAVVVLTLALGIGANTAVFSVLHAVLLAPLPYEQAGQLVRIYTVDEEDPNRYPANYLTGAGVVALRDDLTTVQSLATLNNYRQITADLTDGDVPERVRVLPVSADYFRVLRIEPILGRTFRRDEENPDARVAVVSSRIWRSYLGGEADAPGRSLTLDGARFTVVGVMPQGFRDPLQGRIDVLVAQNLVLGSGNNWDNHYLTVLARLRPGTMIEALQAELEAVVPRHRELGAEDDEVYLASSLREDLVGAADTTLWVLMGAVGLVFLIACVNVAGVTLARGAAREKELAIRSALGSGRGRLARQLLTESTILALAGGLAGLGLGWAVVDSLVALAPPELPGLENAALNARVFLFGFIASLAAGLLTGLVPALHGSRTDLDAALREGGRGATEGRRQGRFRRGLVVAEVALALVLLSGAGILMRSFQELRSVDLALEPSNVVTFEVNLPGRRYDAPARARFHPDLHERLRGLPGVEAVGAVSWLPVSGSYHSWGVRKLNDDGSTAEPIGANQRVVEGDYFRALEIELLQGRLFGPADGPDAPRSYVVNRLLVESLFPDRDPIGRQIGIGPWVGSIIGVVEDVPVTVRGDVLPKVYHSHLQFADNRNWFMVQVVKLRGATPGFLDQARRTLAAMDSDLVLYSPRPLSQVVGRGRASERFSMILLVAFAGVALLLATVGLYGVLAHAVSRRRQEIGVRIALGAASRRVLAMVVGQGMRLAALGVGVGLVAAFGLTRWLESLVYQVSVTDPTVFAAVPLVVLGVALVASWVPAGKAAGVDPSEALRQE